MSERKRVKESDLPEKQTGVREPYGSVWFYSLTITVYVPRALSTSRFITWVLNISVELTCVCGEPEVILGRGGNGGEKGYCVTQSMVG